MNTIGMLLPAATVRKKAVIVNMYMVQKAMQDMSALYVRTQTA